MKKSSIQNYINNFRRRLTPNLRPGIGLVCQIHPATAGGAVIIFQLGPEIENDDIYKEESPTLGSALSKIEQRAFGGNIENFHFGGTNVVLESNRLIFIKDGNSEEWTDSAAAKDVSAVLTPNRGARK